MDILSSLESLLQAGLIAAALLVALWSANKSRRPDPASAPTGEIVWSTVAVAMLAAVAAAVRVGGGHGG